MHVKSIAECSKWSIQQYFWPSLSYQLLLGSLFCLFWVAVLHRFYCILEVMRNLPYVAQSVTCLATDASLTADPGVTSSIPAQSHNFVEIHHEIISTVILLPFCWMNHSRRVVVSYKGKYVNKVLVNGLFKLAQEKVWLGELTIPPWP